MPYWNPLWIAGRQVDLSHLEPFEFEIAPKGHDRPARIGVIFNNHCFSEGFDPALHGAPLPKTHVSAHEVRGFSDARYRLSALLPDEIRGLGGKRIAQTRHGELVRIRLADGRDYAIFFTLKKAGASRCDMFVLSAYPLDRPKHQVAVTGEMKFEVAVSLVLAGKKPRFPSGRF